MEHRRLRIHDSGNTRKGTKEKNNKHKKNERNKEQEQNLTIMGVRVGWDFMLQVGCSGGLGFVSKSSREPRKSQDLSASHRHALWDISGCNRVSLMVRELGNFGSFVICQQVSSGALGALGFVSRSARELRESWDLSVSPRLVLRDVTQDTLVT